MRKPCFRTPHFRQRCWRGNRHLGRHAAPASIQPRGRRGGIYRLAAPLNADNEAQKNGPNDEKVPRAILKKNHIPFEGIVNCIAAIDQEGNCLSLRGVGIYPINRRVEQ